MSTKSAVEIDLGALGTLGGVESTLRAGVKERMTYTFMTARKVRM